MTLWLLVLSEYQRVTDRQTDTLSVHMHSRSHHNKNWEVCKQTTAVGGCTDWVGLSISARESTTP